VETVTPKWQTVETSRGNLMNCCHVVIRGHVYHDSGQSLPFQFPGESWDIGDKSLYKSVTGARKYALACLFDLKGGTDPESDERTSAAVADGQAPREGGRQQRADQRQRGNAAAAAPAASAPAEPPKKSVSDKIKEAPAAAALATLLMELSGRYPVGEFSDRWHSWLGLAEEKAATFDEGGKASVMACVYGQRGLLATAAADAAKAAPTPTTAAAAAAPQVTGPTPAQAPLAPPCPSHEDVLDWVDAQMTAADLEALMEMLQNNVRCANIRANPERFGQMVAHAKQKTEINLHASTWNVDECEPLLTRLVELGRAVDAAKAEAAKEAPRG
jgi:hypothetical protein